MNNLLRSWYDRAAFIPGVVPGVVLGLALGVAASTAAAQGAPTTPFAAPQPPGLQGGSSQEAREVTALLRAGRVDAAAAKVAAMLARDPKDAQARFLEGLVLADQRKTGAAIVAFRTLTEDYPELPEPYNNLASLYASSGQLDSARLALEAAVRANPSYVTAWENLGDLYARMAREAYGKVLQVDKSNAAVQAKLASLRNAIAVPAPAGTPAAKLPGR